ncbi:glycosyltransferase family 2 protein [Algibacter sp. PT7-4]|uniref:glycosyltransferase family 2 protein n=1 Tax=Algibacter ulvanivorans TaxID=3400999 RepID=UPI003AAC07C5
MLFSVSVIIPVFNAGRFIEKAIQSALIQEEVQEVIVVNDGSTDNSLVLIKELQKTDQRIKIFHHKNNENKGRSISRNLGIKKATGNYMAFLDADDFFLENRFLKDKELFETKQECDGVYNAIGAEFYRKPTLTEKEELTLFTVKKKIKPKDLFKVLIEGEAGHFSIDALTVKKSIFNKVGYFNKSLEVSEDTELLWRMALKCNLEAGIIDRPVAMRGVHQENVFNNQDLYKKNRIKMYKSLAIWSGYNNVSVQKKDRILKWLWLLRFKENYGWFKDTLFWLGILIKAPSYMLTILSVKYFPLVRKRQQYFSFFYKK